MTPARFRWGMLLVLVGLILLLQNLEVINSNFWADFIFYLPFLLIAIGIEKIFAKTKAQYVAYITTVLVFVGAIWIVLSGSRGGTDDSYFSETSYSIPRDSSVSSLRALIELGQGDLTVRDATDQLFDGQFREFSVKPVVSYKAEGNEGVLSLTGKAKRWLGGVVRIDDADNSDWYVSFSNVLPLSLECTGKESDVHLNLATTPVKRVKVRVDDGTIYLKIGTEEPEVDVSVEGENSELRLRVPESAGLKVSGVEDDDYLLRFHLMRRNGSYISEGFDTLSNRIQVDLDDRLSSLNIDYY